jgi:hypothetical protein
MLVRIRRADVLAILGETLFEFVLFVTWLRRKAKR